MNRFFKIWAAFLTFSAVVIGGVALLVKFLSWSASKFGGGWSFAFLVLSVTALMAWFYKDTEL